MRAATSQEPAPVDWRPRSKRLAAWTLREFAKLCCGWDPSSDEIPDLKEYRAVVEEVTRAAGSGVIPVIGDGPWPVTGADRVYEDRPAFRPSDVAAWAGARFPSFPFRELATSGELGKRERDTLYEIIRACVALLKIGAGSSVAVVIEAQARDNESEVRANTIQRHLKAAGARTTAEATGKRDSVEATGKRDSVDQLIAEQ